MWWWVLGWCLLVLLALVFLGLIGWGLVKRILELGREVGRSADRLSPALDQIADAYVPARSVLSEPRSIPAPRRRTRRGARHRHQRGVR